jgi:hypothetical protein
MRTVLLYAFLVASTAILSSSAGLAATYYVSNQGADSADGLSPQTAWATLARVNRGPLQPGDRVLFRRNDRWRGTLVPHSGNASAPITYASFGEGQKPLLLGSVAKSDPAQWTDEGNHIWAATELSADVGNIIFGKDATCGVKKWRQADLKNDGDYWYEQAGHRVKVRMSENPAKRYAPIECALCRHIILENNCSYVTYENLLVKYGAAHGIGGGNTHHIIVRDCDFGFIGGGNQYGGDKTVRFGNGVEFWASAHDNLVERCRLWEVYDAALTNQSLGPRTPQTDIVYRNNVIWNCEYSFEYWNRPAESETRNIEFVGNKCSNAGYGWGHAQRPDPSGCHLRFYDSPARAENIVIRDNTFDGAKGPAFFAPGWSKAQVDALVMDRNRWRQDDGVMIQLPKSSYTMAEFGTYQKEWAKEPHSMVLPLSATPLTDGVKAR